MSASDAWMRQEERRGGAERVLPDAMCSGVKGGIGNMLLQWDGATLPATLRARLKREWQKVQSLTEQIGSLEAERRAELRTSAEPELAQVRQLATLRGLGVNSAWLFVMELFAWQGLQTPKQVGA